VGVEATAMAHTIGLFLSVGLDQAKAVRWGTCVERVWRSRKVTASDSEPPLGTSECGVEASRPRNGEFQGRGHRQLADP